MTTSKAVRHDSAARLGHWVRRAEILSAELPRSLDLLRLIEDTLRTLRREREFVEIFTRFINEELHEIQGHPERPVLDKKGVFEDKLLKVQKVLRRYHEQLGECQESARLDPSLKPEDEVPEEFGKSRAAIAALNNALNSLRFAIASHDAKKSPVVGEFRSVDELVRFMEK